MMSKLRDEGPTLQRIRPTNLEVPQRIFLEGATLPDLS
jgi:hypothetical protein